MNDRSDRACPLFIVGHPRSGTTLALHLLQSSGEFPKYNFPESHFYSHFYRRFGDLQSARNRRRFLNSIRERRLIASTDVSVDAVVDLWSQRGLTYGGFLSSLLDLVAESQGLPRWVEKTPYHALYLPEIARDFPTAKFLHIVRDPRDVALSVIGAGWKPASTKTMSRVAFVWSWISDLVEAFGVTHPTKVLTLQYEELATAPESSISRINKWLGTEMQLNRILENGEGVLGGTNSSFGDEFSGISAQALRRWVKSEHCDRLLIVDTVAQRQMKRLGYDPRPGSLALVAASTALRSLYRIEKQARALAFPLTRR